MTDREELIQDICVARFGPTAWEQMSEESRADFRWQAEFWHWAVREVVEPDIRAEEWERHGNNCRGMWDEWVEDLREKVEALQGRDSYWDDALDEVMDLLR